MAEAVAREARLSKIDAVKALNAFVKVAVEALRGDEKILLTGLGTLRSTVTPSVWDAIPAPAHPCGSRRARAVRFRPSRTIED
ncbi:HU family DNA-binding protein [Alistipes putredinis]|uniref:HU family DNA-binding protein n=1 Tax=Alistipes putredinis TaxID=28117 RepID=UPI003990FFB5